MGVILLRHTKPDVAEGTCYGRTDLDVAPSFEADAARALKALPPIDRIVTSPLRRCSKLAQFLAADYGLDLQIDPQLQEMDFGSWEGRLWADIERTELDAWAADFYRARPHGGENVAGLAGRTQRALNAAYNPDRTTLVVTHAGIIKAAFAKGIAAQDFGTQIEFGTSMVWTPRKDPHDGP